jgi:hypothetical protein
MTPPPVAYGYMRVLDGMPDQEVRLIENRLRAYATAHGLELAAVHGEYDDGVTDLGSLLSVLVRHGAAHVIVPSLDQITDHVVIQAAVAAAITHDAGATLHIAADER